ncbi:unnamed protein product [Haemonchus placei]|uniref:MFS domain-containing protein n=1 Tax=Haemonchus placei TaxID=6290 RepID=A0A0N4WYD0_HAEPC|nr:unnamed protein product [Haemonchus placei]
MMLMLGCVAMILGMIHGSISMAMVCITSVYRAKRILTCSLLVCGIGSLVTPLVVLSHSHWLLAFARAIIGMGNGDHIGILCSMAFTSIFCQTKFLGGWPVAFELYGFIALGFLVIWELHAAHKPRYSSYVTASELEHIRGNRLKRSAFCNFSEQPPLKPLLLSPCVIAMCLCCFTHSFILSGLTAYLPMFNRMALHMSLDQFNQFVLSYLYAYSQLAGTVSPIVIALLVSEGIEKKILISLMVAFMLCNGVTLLVFAHGRRELYVDIYGHTTASAIRRTTGKLHSEQEIIPGHHSAIPYPSTAIRYREEEVNIPLKPTSTSRDLSEEEFTSDDEF